MTKPYRVLVTGSRDWTDGVALDYALRATLYLADAVGRASVVVVHGAARGADLMASRWCDYTLVSIAQEPHRADWEKHGKAAGPIRNQEMVDAGADICLAFPLGESRGTRDCMERARKAGIPVLNFGDPDDRAADA